jgi:2-desacetyl-2-hydroxyethyl bacteriochlorophyllide A dehydrogenase
MNEIIPELMHALVWEAPQRMNIRKLPIPSPNPDEVLIKVAYVGICGSELSGYLGKNALRVPPLVMGHEFSGEVVNFGTKALLLNPDLEMGQAVTANPMVYCNECEFCHSGQNHLCINRKLIGAHRPGAFAEYITVPAWMIEPLPEGFSLRSGALVEPLACGVRVSGWAGEMAGQSALIAGAGPIGLFGLQTLLINGAKQVFVSDTDADRRNIALTLGGTVVDPLSMDVVKTVRDATQNRGVKVAIDAVGKAITRQQCISSVKTGGTIILCGLHEEISSMPVAEVIRREITLQGCFCYTPQNFKSAIELLSSGKASLDTWTIEAPLGDGGLWFERLSSGKPQGVAKVLLVPGRT